MASAREIFEEGVDGPNDALAGSAFLGQDVFEHAGEMARITLHEGVIEPFFRVEVVVEERDVHTCLAGDVWGTYDFPKELKVGDFVIFDNAARYTMVKMNWFNGVQMPSIVVRRLDGRIELVREFTYDDFRSSLS